MRPQPGVWPGRVAGRSVLSLSLSSHQLAAMACRGPEELITCFRSINPKSIGGFAKKRQNPIGRAFQHLALRARARQDTDAEEYAQEQPGEVVRWTGVGDRAAFLPRLDTAAKEGLDKDHLLDDELLEFGVIGRQFQRRVHQ